MECATDADPYVSLRLRIVGYARVSTAEQGANGAGLAAQRAAVEAECARRGWQLVRIEEDVLSGRTLRRPGLQRLVLRWGVTL